MVRAHINRGRVEVRDPIPPAWDGQMVKLIPLTPEDPLPDLDQRIAALLSKRKRGRRRELDAKRAERGDKKTY